MYEKRRLGVKEGNAIDVIVTYQSKKDRGEATGPDYHEYCIACQVLGINQTSAGIVHPGYYTSVPRSDNHQVPVVNFMVPAVAPVPDDFFKILKWSGIVIGGWILLAAIYHVFS